MASVLLIDDNDALRDLMVMALRSAGHTVLPAGNGADALRILQEQAFDVVVTDVVMPDMDGLEVLQRAKVIQPGLRVVVISGDAPRNAPLYLKIATHFGAHRTLLKPFVMAELLAAVA